MGTTAIAMPKLGMTMEEGTVVEWPVALGQHVEKGQIVLVIESEKNEAEIEATAAGFLRHVYVDPGEVVPCKTLLAALTDAVDEPFDAETFATEHRARYGPEPAAAEPAPATPAASAGPAVAAPSPARRPVAPAARALARKLGLDLDAIRGTGPHGRVVRQDVEAHVAARERLVEVEPGVGLEVLREGEGEPVLFLPGFGSDVSSFAMQIHSLRPTHTCIGLNPRGVGGSDAPEADVYAVERAADDAAAICDTPTHIVGASLGAATALELALRHPERVRSLTLITPFLVRSARLRAVTEAWARLAAEASPEAVASFLLPWLFSETYLADDTARERTLRGLAPAVARVPAATLERTRAGLEAWSGRRSPDDLGELRAPALILIGAQDLLTPDGESVGAALPHAHTIVISGAGHGLAIEEGDTVTRAIREHLASVR